MEVWIERLDPATFYILFLIYIETSETKKLCEIGALIEDSAKTDQLKQQSAVQFILEYDSNLVDLAHKFETKRPWEKALIKIYDEIDPQKLKEMSDKHLQTYFSMKKAHFPRKFNFLLFIKTNFKYT